MNYISVIFLGLIQGLTEFLPVSSSAHLAIARYVMKIQENGLALDVAFHFGTLFSILFYFRSRFAGLVSESVNSKDFKTNPAVIISAGIIPAVFAGLLFKDRIEVCFSNPLLISAFLSITGAFLISTRFRKNGEKRLTLFYALIIGCFQVFALLPGISRAGITISTGILLGVSRKESADFSFFMAVPLILGAGILEIKPLLSLPSGEIILVIAGVFTAFLSGLGAIKLVFVTLSNRNFHNFAWYCFALSGVCFFMIDKPC